MLEKEETARKALILNKEVRERNAKLAKKEKRLKRDLSDAYWELDEYEDEIGTL